MEMHHPWAGSANRALRASIARNPSPRPRRLRAACLTSFLAALILAVGCHDGTAPVPDRINDAVLFESDRDGQLEIYAVSARTRRLWRVTEHSRDDYSPAWSPDRQWIAFVSERDSPGDRTVAEIYVMRFDGSQPRRITDRGTASGSPSWSSDGMSIAYATEVMGRARIATISVDGLVHQDITEGAHDDYDPAWSPAGTRIAFVSSRLDTPTLWVMDADGLNPRRVSDLEYVSRPSWSPLGTQIAVSSNRQIFVVDVDTDQARRVSLETEEARRPVWSPDGSRLAYTSNRFGTFDILVVNAATGALVQRLTESHSTDLTGSWNSR